MGAWDNLGLAVQQKAGGVTGDQHSPWARAGNTPGEMLGVGKRWTEGVGQNVTAWGSLNDPVHKGEPNQRPATKAEVAARVLRAAQGSIGAITGGMGALKDALDVGFANLTAPIAAVFPSFPAATIVSPYMGTPHAHATHPPSGPPPVPPTPCPSLGMTMLGVSPRVLINGKFAARCEDIGLAPTCMGLPPAWFKIKTGSSNVFIGGARAARLLDICKACKNIPEVPDIPAGRVMAAVGKAAGAVSTALGVAGKVAAGLGIAADIVEAAVEDDREIAAAKALNAAMMAVQMAAEKAKEAVEKTMWKDPTIPPTGSMGAVIDPSHATVLIGGFPMVNIPDPVGALLNRLKRYKAKAPPANDSCGEEGEPVNVVTGANLESSSDLPLHDELGLQWNRYYDSSQKAVGGPLGWGWRHELQQALRFDLDGILYLPPSGPPVAFPRLDTDGTTFSRDGLTLERVSATTYLLRRPGRATHEYQVATGTATARLLRIFEGNHELRLYHGEHGRLAAIHGSSQRPIQVEYDVRGRLTALTTAIENGSRARLVGYEYSDGNDLIAWTDALGHAATLEYDDRHQLTRKGDRRGYSDHYAYDADGRCIHTSGEDGMYDVRFAYLTEGRCTQATHGDGGVWSFFYDEAGTIVRIVDPYGRARERIVAPSGQVTAEIDAAGNAFPILYDASGGVIGRQDPFGFITEDLRDLRRHNHLELAAPETPLEWEHGGLLRPAEIEPQPSIEVFRDALGRTVEERFEGFSRRWAYDGNGNVIAFKDGDDALHRYEYASWNMLRREIDPVGNVTEYAYTAREQVTTIADAGGTLTQYTYDLRDNIVRVTRNGRVREEYARDATDNLIGKRDADGRALLNFDIGARNVKQVRQLASGDRHRFEYDEAGRLILAATETHETGFEYLLSRRPVSDIRNGRGVRYRFAGPGRITAVVLDNFEIRYDKTPYGARLIVDPAGGRHLISAHADGSIVLDCSNGTTETRRYDYRGLTISKMRTSRGGAAPWHREYSYSAEGELLGTRDSRGGTTRYQYDAAHRLRLEVRPDGTRIRYGYDAANNLLSQNGLVAVIGDGNRLNPYGEERFTYNDRDHIASRTKVGKTTHYEYDSCDRLVRCTTPGGEWESTYDPLGRRVSKTWLGRTTQYYWDDNRLAAERHPDGRLRIYVYVDVEALTPFLFLDYDSDTSAADSGRRYFIATDQIGTPVRVEDDKGQPVWLATVAPYGSTQLRNGSTIDFALRFPGHYEDSELGLFYNRFRHYDPALGRYLQSDPMGIAGGTNLYAYASNPLTAVDVFGLHKPKKEDGPGKKTTGEDDENGRAERKAKKKEISAVDGSEVPGAATVVEHSEDGKVVARYYLDKDGRTIRAEGLLDPPANYTKEGVSGMEKPPGYVDDQDHRGHLIPERSAASQPAVNVPENVIPEHGRESNLSAKKRWENEARKEADKNPGSWSVHEPNYDGDDPRPTSVNHSLYDKDGNEIPTVNNGDIPNPDYS